MHKNTEPGGGNVPLLSASLSLLTTPSMSPLTAFKNGGDETISIRKRYIEWSDKWCWEAVLSVNVDVDISFSSQLPLRHLVLQPSDGN